MATRKVAVNDKLPSVTKRITQESINDFESCGILDRENIHNSPEIARQRLGTSFPIASGRMSVTYATEVMRRYFGSQVFNHSGSVNLKFLRPVKAGDTITVTGEVSESERVAQGVKYTVNLICQNQNGDQTAVGVGTAVVP
ncbi:MAG: MaoC family dehydratase [SAR202 cluster bacterium]|nr:MaoC family dehydratase [SAR202 cluster bacterium]